ncbi:hypothetical protein PSHT_02038 [Puccinia striiformis]|uniref:Uncharacterized protein n=1 Tax=Puccinia striiformis TaxID=27350 RepID=A0A2S4WJ00_9BASI|nr:hypothetical protein PSHT_02038 [Puccinia striiformis]
MKLNEITIEETLKMNETEKPSGPLRMTKRSVNMTGQGAQEETQSGKHTYGEQEDSSMSNGEHSGSTAGSSHRSSFDKFEYQQCESDGDNRDNYDDDY